MSKRKRRHGRDGYGSNPTLPAPENTLIPTVNVAKATGWPEGGTPVAAQGFSVSAYAAGLDTK